MGLVDSIISAESGGDPTAKNPMSSASGPSQFIDSTWLSTIKQHRPDLAQNMSDADLLALKSNPQLSRDMTAAYAADNGAILSKAGLPVTPGTTYLAHFAGPQGAVKVLSSDPNMPVGDVLGAGAVKANPFLQGMTVADLRSWADRKMGATNTASAAPNAPLSLTAQTPAAQRQAAPQTIPAPQAPTAQSGGYFAQIPVNQIQAPPIYFAPRRQINLAALQQALAAQAPIFPKG